MASGSPGTNVRNSGAFTTPASMPGKALHLQDDSDAGIEKTKIQNF
jgi:hypothetical protein